MRKMLFKASRNAKRLVRIHLPEGHNFFYRRPGLRQRSGFVKHDRFRLSHSFEILSTFYGHMIKSGFPNG